MIYSFVIVAPIVCGALCLVLVLLGSIWCLFSSFAKERAG